MGCFRGLLGWFGGSGVCLGLLLGSPACVLAEDMLGWFLCSPAGAHAAPAAGRTRASAPPPGAALPAPHSLPSLELQVDTGRSGTPQIPPQAPLCLPKSPILRLLAASSSFSFSTFALSTSFSSGDGTALSPPPSCSCCGGTGQGHVSVPGCPPQTPGATSPPPRYLPECVVVLHVALCSAAGTLCLLAKGLTGSAQHGLLRDQRHQPAQEAVGRGGQRGGREIPPSPPRVPPGSQGQQQ